MLALQDLAYSRSYIGFSFHGQPNASLQATYLTVLLNSPLFLYFILMTSSKLGCERSTLQKVEAEAFPICPFEQLSARQLELLKNIERAILKKDDNRDSLAQTFVRDIYKIRSADLALIEDRLAYSMPFGATRKRAASEPKPEEAEIFREALINGLAPFDMSAHPIQVELFEPSVMSPWRFLRVGGFANRSNPSAKELLDAAALGDMLDASRVEIPYGDALYLGILNQGRFWTRTAARTLSLDLVRRGHPVLSRGAA